MPSFSTSAVRVARVLAGLSLADVGQSLDVSRQFIQQLETGERLPNPDLIQRLARVLDVEPNFFSKPINETIHESSVYFRCLRKTPDRERERARVGVAVYRRLITRLAEELKFPTVKVPTISVASLEDIERAALTTRAVLDLGIDGPIRNLVRAVERAGVFVTDLHCTSPTINAFSARVQPPIVVRSTAKGSTSQSRFDLAHELGHLVMHPKAEQSQCQEDEANRFAGAFLVPRDALKREFPRWSTRVWPELFRLKARWGMSVSAIVVRAHQLGMIDDAQYRTLFMRIARAGWRRNPEPDEPAPEFPELVPLAFREIHRARQVHPTQILSEMGWSESLFERVVGDGVAHEVLSIGAPAVLKMRSGSSRRSERGDGAE